MERSGGWQAVGHYRLHHAAPCKDLPEAGLGLTFDLAHPFPADPHLETDFLQGQGLPGFQSKPEPDHRPLLAAEMIQLQAARESRPGIAFPIDSVWQREFDAAFPYQETSDQLDAIVAIKADMQQPKPMDRLLCGDVGFGKTELSIRAAFKAIDAGYQVAVLVPTTVLAEQHRRTFSQRMAKFPFHIDALSRFRAEADL